MPGPGGAQSHLQVVPRGPGDRERGPSQVWDRGPGPGPPHLAVSAEGRGRQDEGLWPLQLSGEELTSSWSLN